MSYLSASFRNSFRASRSAGVAVMTDDDLRAAAPSIFAEDKHESRSEKYVYVPTSEIVGAMRREGFEPFTAKQGNSRVEGKQAFTKHMVRFRHVGEQDVTRRIGATYPEVVVINSHDGTSSYQVMSGLFRMVCLNGLIVADSELASVKVPHKGNISGQIIEASYTVLSESRRAIERADEWSGIVLSDVEQAALADEVHAVRFGDAEGHTSTPIPSAALLTPRRAADLAPDLWTVANRLQENALRGGLRGRTPTEPGRPSRRVSSRAVEGIDGDVRINRAVWRLAEKMAEIKSA